MSNKNTPKITLSNIESIKDALEIQLEALEGVKIFGVTAGADWNHDDSCYYAECMIGDGSTYATIRLERECGVDAPDKGVDYEQECYDLGEELGSWLQEKFGADFDYGVELAQ